MQQLRPAPSPTAPGAVGKPPPSSSIAPHAPDRGPADETARAKRARILEAARLTFVDRGFAETNLNEVARRAGVGKGTVYRLFESKAELFVASLLDDLERLRKDMEEAAPGRASALERLEALAHAYVGFWRDHPHLFRVFWALQSQDAIGPLSPALRQEVERVCEAPLRSLEGALSRAVEGGEIRPCDPPAMARALVGLANACVGPVIDPDRYGILAPDPDAVCSEALGLALRGLAPA